MLPRAISSLLGLGTPEMPPELHRHKGAKGRIAPETPLGEASFVVFDTELTGLSYSKDSIVSIGAIKMHGGRIKPADAFYRLVKPESALNGASVCIHELTPDELEAGADDARDVLRDFVEFAGDAVLVGHFVQIDVTFTTRAMRKHFSMGLQSRAVDTAILHDWFVEHNAVLSRHFGGMCRDRDLFHMSKHYGIEPGKSHNALSDAYLTAQLFQRLMAFLPECGIKSLGGLIRVAGL